MTKPRRSMSDGAVLIKEAATYSPALHCSTIGAGGLNFSVRDGKRWDPAAKTTRISQRRYRAPRMGDMSRKIAAYETDDKTEHPAHR